MAEKSGASTGVLGSESPPTKGKFCYHCNDYVSRATYYRHREQFYNPVTQVWRLSGAEGISSMGSEVDVSFNDHTVMESTGESFEGLDSEVILMDADFKVRANLLKAWILRSS